MGETRLGIAGDAGTLGLFTLGVGNFATIVPGPITAQPPRGFTINEVGRSRWFRFAVSMETPGAGVNLPGTSVSISDAEPASQGRYGEAVIVDAETQDVRVGLTVINMSRLTGGGDNNIATFWVNWLSADTGLQ